MRDIKDKNRQTILLTHAKMSKDLPNCYKDKTNVTLELYIHIRNACGSRKVADPVRHTDRLHANATLRAAENRRKALSSKT